VTDIDDVVDDSKNPRHSVSRLGRLLESVDCRVDTNRLSATAFMQTIVGKKSTATCPQFHVLTALGIILQFV